MLTARETQLLRFIESYMAAHDGVAPSYREMKEGLGQTSLSGIHRFVHGLEEMGVIRRVNGRGRGIEIVDKPKPRAHLIALLKRAHEELRLIRMKDSGAVYDVTIRAEIEIALAKES
jgi:SOS-response transcriptional repressor LexA